jgi:acyl-CoA hydrolase
MNGSGGHLDFFFAAATIYPILVLPSMVETRLSSTSWQIPE